MRQTSAMVTAGFLNNFLLGNITSQYGELVWRVLLVAITSEHGNRTGPKPPRALGSLGRPRRRALESTTRLLIMGGILAEIGLLTERSQAVIGRAGGGKPALSGEKVSSNLAVKASTTESNRMALSPS